MIPDILRQRLFNQRIAETSFTKPEQVVSWFGAMQAQEFAVSKWAIGLRASGLVDADVEKAFNDGKILRTHALRPTWHFVAPADIRWMVMLNNPRVYAIAKTYWKKLELNDKIITRSNNILVKELQNRNQLTRNDIREALEKNKIRTDESRLSHFLMAAELDALICSGARLGKQFTYALLDNRVAATKPFTKDEAVAELAKRYFQSHGPATIYDFAWWSGLTMADVRKGIEALPKKFICETIDNKEYIFIPTNKKLNSSHQVDFLMPDYDEYGIAYKERSALNPHKIQAIGRNGNIIFNRLIVMDGVVIGGWKTVQTKNGIDVQTFLKVKLNKTKQQSLQKAVKRYKDFVSNSTF